MTVGSIGYGTERIYDFGSLTYDGWPPVTGTRTAFGSRLFDLLPDYVRDADDGTLRSWLTAVGDANAPVEAFINASDPDTSVSGTSEPVNPAACPAGWLGWLGWLTGVDVGGLSVSQARWLLSQSGAQAHGSAGSMRLAVQATLTGTRFCQVTTHVGGDPWAMGVQVLSSEVADSALTLAVALREKPAGVVLTLSSSAPVTYDDVDAGYADYAALAATGKTYDEVRF